MTNFVASSHSFEHSGLVRVHRAVLFLQAAAVGVPRIPSLPAGIAAFVRRSSVTLRAGYRAWVSSRRQAAEDERTWNAALKDARLMAELSRAMQGAAR